MSEPLTPEHRRIVDRAVTALLAVFYGPDGRPVVANDRPRSEDKA